MAEKPKRRRYSLVMDESTFNEIEEVAFKLDSNLVDVIKRFLRLALLIYKYQQDPDVKVMIHKKDENPIELRII